MSAESLPSLNLDLARAKRCGYPEVVYGAGKTVAETVTAAQRLVAAHGRVLVTRCREEQLAALQAGLPDGEVWSRCGAFLVGPLEARGGMVLVVSAGTSDEVVAEEVVVTLRARGAHYQRLQDCGVAGIHRLLSQQELLAQAQVVVAVAG
ncbi:MAG: 1-(5-phosphoribosyl)-5-amino-4-imidazole-carboxylate carboxylase, partial [Planctomycetota bacterium]